ncbi:fatty acyl-CoA reductase 2-like, partial [Atheta coriaria]|uniref:fatty acyl-CoA reductase 2-like n=1 Tax=Dalotia coriaria TaxID=877792 RepID=UPI0031F38800
MERAEDRVAKMFANKVILITGVTGFVGKVLLEKLLRSCPHIRKIYVIIRPKYKMTSEERLEKIFKSALFDLFKQNPSSHQQISQVFAIQGDISATDLGLSATDRFKLLSEVDIVYHCAALLRLDESLKTSVLMNVR